MKLAKPVKGTLNLTQPFSDKHPGWDFTVLRTPLFGAPLCAMERCVVERVTGDTYELEGQIAELKRGYGIWLRGLETGFTYLYWHILPIVPVREGDVVATGQIVAFMGNTGYVVSGGVPVPVDNKVRYGASKPGTHCHLEILGPGYRVGTPKRGFLDPADLIDLSTEPTYTTADFLKAASVVAAKALKLIKR